jgi:hypothetical protein
MLYGFITNQALVRALGVLLHQVVDADDGWAANGGVVSVMVVEVEPGVKSPHSRGL